MPEMLTPSQPDADRLARLMELADLRDRGALTDEEFAAEKARLLASPAPGPAAPRGGPAPRPASAGKSQRASARRKRWSEGPLTWREKAKAVVVLGTFVVILAAAVSAIIPSSSKPKPHGLSAADTAGTAALRANWTLPIVCGGASPECVPASDVSMSSGTVTVQTDWADTPLVTANASGGGEVSPGQISVAAQLCTDAETAATIPATLAAANAGGGPTYVPVDVYGQNSALLAWSNPDGTCSS